MRKLLKMSPEKQCQRGREYLLGENRPRSFRAAYLCFALAYKEPAAQFWLGLMSEQGWGMRANPEEAIQHYSQAIELGDRVACSALAYYYRHGIGVPRDLEFSLALSRQAGFQLEAQAWFEKGLGHERGDSGEVDYQAALLCYETAAGCGHGEAQVQAAICHQAGLGTQVNMERALNWYEVAAEQGMVRAQVLLARYYEFGPGAVNDMLRTLRQSDLKQQSTAEDAHDTKGIAQGIATPDSPRPDTTVDMEHAFGWYLKAARQGNTLAQNRVGVCYARGEGVAQNAREAFIWFSLAASVNDGNGLANQAMCYFHGFGVPVNKAEASRLAKLAMAQGMLEAERWLRQQEVAREATQEADQV
jgi:TPR repeat protein